MTFSGLCVWDGGGYTVIGWGTHSNGGAGGVLFEVRWLFIEAYFWPMGYSDPVVSTRRILIYIDGGGDTHLECPVLIYVVFMYLMSLLMPSAAIFANRYGHDFILKF